MFTDTHTVLEETEPLQPLVETYFHTRGYQLIGYVPTPAGFLLLMCRNESLQLAYCLPTHLALSSLDVDVCERAMRRYEASGGYVVTRGGFLPNAHTRARELGVRLIDGATLLATG